MFNACMKLGLIGLIVLVSACGTIPKRNPLPRDEVENASIPGLPEDARFWGDEVPEIVLKRFREESDAELHSRLPAWTGSAHHYLAVSGGGQDGAFSAGLLNGWTASGTRPDFLLVTGISTGALVAPFAFLGSDYDDKLKEIYTTLSTEDLLDRRPWTMIVTSDAAVDTDKLRSIIARFVDDKMLQRLAAANQQGRRLYIGTTNLDARRPVIWNITSIASSNYPKKRALIVDVLLASASIPGAFPPVLIEVEANGRRYDEIHVDGGAASQVFVYPRSLDLGLILNRLNVTEPPKIYVIRNAKLTPKWEAVEASIFEIANTSISSLIRTQGIGDLYQIYFLTQRDGAEYYLAYIPDTFDQESDEPFDIEYMSALYRLGRELAKDGYPWERTPPGARGYRH